MQLIPVLPLRSSALRLLTSELQEQALEFWVPLGPRAPCLLPFRPYSAPTALHATLEATQRQLLISLRCYLREVAFERELPKETIYLSLGHLQDGKRQAADVLVRVARLS